ncbi:hypothetical protein KUTeg_025071 [Tegillarca granosa]|uniref:phosphatidylinositol-3,5-bisphosphate 3-phosphatase n=1 Tax=Tegillarca granosa TaxID=220873 RepID=A0ABQ9E4X0_TEGGR|nr:hypothetical protein KUTeg_025071 [Tegillarca granosa]
MKADRYLSLKYKNTYMSLISSVFFVCYADVFCSCYILHMHISTIEKLALTTGGSPLQIRCKDFRCITFVIPRDRDCQDVYASLLELSKPASIDKLYAFIFTQSDDMPKSYGWEMYDTQTEYLRLGVPNELWVLTNINRDYEICDTYPRHLYVPVSASTPVLVGSSKFRSRGRLPVLSYLHRTNQMLHAILKANPKSQYMYVVDTRPKINAMANKAAVCEMKNPSMNALLSGLDGSGWLKHIKAIIDTSVFVAQAVKSGVSVLLHCSDGWDRTAQTCSLASIMLDPYYRTVQGFQTVDPKETSPVFTQFIETVWQIMVQFPCAFQFNERFLITIHDHAFSCQFGTFIGNCEKDRIDLRLSERTYSLWGYLTKNMSEYLNPLYKKEYEIDHPVIIPKSSPQCIKFWKGMYNRYENGIHPREHISDILSAAKDHSASLEDHRITQICKVLGKSEETIQKKLDGYLSMESLDGILAGHMDDLSLPKKSLESKLNSQNDNNKNISKDLSLDNKDMANIIKSDSESGFDESSSQMSKSGIEELNSQISRTGTEDGCGTLDDASMLSRSASFEQLSLDQLLLELKSFHCWKCGDVFCTRCIAKSIPLPGHYSHRPVPVCRPCYKDIRHSPSMEFPQVLNRIGSS